MGGGEGNNNRFSQLNKHLFNHLYSFNLYFSSIGFISNYITNRTSVCTELHDH